MKEKIFKIVSVFGFLSAIVSANAADNSAKSYEQGMPIEESQMSSGYNAPARIDVQGSWDLFIDGEFLFWQACADNLAYATYSADPVYYQPPYNGKLFLEKNKWKPGVRVKAGLGLNNDDWILDASWTHLIGRSKGSSTRAAGTSLIPLIYSSAFTNADYVSGHAKNNFNMIDLNFGRPFYLGKSLTVSPVMGFRGHWNRISNTVYAQNVTYLYYAQEGGFIIPATGSLDWLKQKSSYHIWGLGPKAAVASNWLFGKGFRMFGEADFALLFERTTAKAKETASASFVGVLRDGDTITNLKVKKQNLFRPNTKAEFGLGWGTYFDHSNWYVDLALAYEVHFWLDMLTASSTYGNVWYQGGTFKFRLDF